MLSSGRIDRAVGDAERDPLRRQLHERIVALARQESVLPPVQRILIGPRLLEQSRICLRRVLMCSMAYWITRDTRFVEGAKKEMLAAAAFEDWNPGHFLDTAEMGLALALGYDWLHDQLTPSERGIIATALQRHLLSFADEAYGPAPSSDKRLHFVRDHHNWNQVCNTGMLAAALALADEDPALADRVVEGVRRSLPLAMEAYQPDGAYPEGPMYWGYGTSFNVMALSILETALGSDFDLGRMPAFNLTAGYRLQVQSPIGKFFNYGDSDAGSFASPEYTWLAERYGPAAAAADSRDLLRKLLETKPDAARTERLFALHALWFPEDTPRPVAPAPLDVHYRGPVQLAIFRSAWNDPHALYVGFKAGRNKVNHSHLDLGSFILDAEGVRWLLDLGRDRYDLPGYFSPKRWEYYRLQTRSHNTLTFDDASQSLDGNADITAFASEPRRAFAIADLTPAYPGAAKRIRRGISVLERAHVLVQDEVEGLPGASHMTWRVLTDAQVRTKGPRELELQKEGRRLRVELLFPSSAAFTVTPAKPPTAIEDQNTGVSQLAIRSDGAENLRVLVRFSPVGDRWPVAPVGHEIQPLSDW